jgi:F-type H+-transporting ATPase subunit epsilon
MVDTVQSSSLSHELQCVVLTPETTVLETKAAFVALPLEDGQMGIAPLHSPMIGRLGYGEVRVVNADGTRSFYVDGGFVQVAGNLVSVLTRWAVRAEELDAERIAEQLAEALGRPAHGEEQMAIRARHVARIRAQLHVARRARQASET